MVVMVVQHWNALNVSTGKFYVRCILPQKNVNRKSLPYSGGLEC